MESDDDRTESFVPLTKGVKVGHYTIVEKIGAGGMGEVYLAEDTKLKRQVALKFLPYQFLSDENAKARFTREAQAAAKLNHPNIVTIYEVSEYQNRPFFAMECCDGKPLRDIIKEKELSIEETAKLAIQICEGLEKAHNAGIVHRDIKPSNIIVDSDGRAKLVDFGLATVKGTEKLTRTGSTVGTVGYMSPEQVRGEEVDQRSDLFSFGVILYEMITGEAPFEEKYEAATMNAILHNTPKPLKRYKPDTPDILQKVIDKALDKNLETRYQSSADMLSDLARVGDKSEAGKFIGRRDKRYGQILIASFIAVIAILLLIFKPWKLEISAGQEAKAADNKLAIMYFDNLADPEDSQKLGEITANLLITDLSESDYVRVVSSLRLYDILKQLGREGKKKVDYDIATKVANIAKAKWMLLGSILKTEPNIVLTAQLVDVESGNTFATQKIEGDNTEDLFPLVDRLTVEIKNDLSLPSEALKEEDRPVEKLTTNSIEAYRYYLEGEELNLKLYFSESEQCFRKAIELDSTFAMAYMALTIYTRGEEQQYFREKMNQYADDASHLERLEIKVMEAGLSGNDEDYVKYLNEMVEYDPENKLAYWLLAFMEYDSLENKNAIRYFKKVLELDPYYKLVYNELSVIYDRLGDFDSSIWAINKYIEMAPGEANPYDTRGYLYANNGKLDDAIVSFKKALEIKPDFLMAWSARSLGHIYVIKQMYDEAEKYYRMYLASDDQTDRANGRLFLSQIQLHQGKFRHALDLLNTGIEADSLGLGYSRYMLEKIYRRAQIYYYFVREYDSSLVEMERLMFVLNEIDSTNMIWNIRIKGFTDMVLARLDKDRENNETIHGLNEISDRITDNYRYLYDSWRALVEMERTNYDLAIMLFEKNYKIRALAGNIRELGKCYLMAGRKADAVDMLEKFMKKLDDTNLPYAEFYVMGHYWLGTAYEASGWTDKAVEQYEIFLDIWKNADEGLESVKDAKERLARLKSRT